MARDVGAVIPAAGQGVRLGHALPKALVPVRGASLLVHGLRAFERARSIGWIVVAAPPEDRERVERAVRAARLRKVTAVIDGGATRAQSVAKAVAALPRGAGWVAVHDAARPCVTPELIERVVAAAKNAGAAACGLPASVTLKAADDEGRVRLTLDRDGVWMMQTPQAFRRDWFDIALARIDGLQPAGTLPGAPSVLDGMPDDAAILEWAGYPVQLVQGEPANLKVTVPEDLALAEVLLRRRRLAPAKRR